MPLPPPSRFSSARFSIASDSGASTFSANSDSKYPTPNEKVIGKGAFLPYLYDPSEDQDSPPDADDILHDPDVTEPKTLLRGFNLRGIINIVTLTTLIVAIICLFTLYPIVTFFRNQAHNRAIGNNIQVNSTGQVAKFVHVPELIDGTTPETAKSRTGWDGFEYDLVFSDEFNEEGRTFSAGDDPYWEAVDLWYGATQDLEYYTPEQATTVGGSLRLRLDQADPVTNHGLNYKSAMLQTWNKFCFTRGYIEVNVSFPGTNSDVSGYWPGVWTMGNLGRPGYGASTDGLWPYSYTACDVGTFPNQTNKDGLTPEAAAYSLYSRSKYNYELSWLPGQRASACSCPGSDHPGPDVTVGRGAPEIDVLEAQKNKLGSGGKVSQSAQFAPFNHDYASQNDSSVVTWYDLDKTKQNTYQGSALQQAVTALTTVPDRAYAGTGAEYVTMGFEYWGNVNDATDGFITWFVDGTPSFTMRAGAVGPDNQTMIDQRLIPREAMSIVLNLGMSESFQTVDFDALTFPSDFLIDYVRVYQRKGELNVGCSPPDYPTKEYITDHMQAYTSAC
ncbi:glycoside hydrolase family 16 protein [Sphaerobolus stellatus SS14]|nr:glycoside hydrolase family 16 protein [Sphaerobolus stellatus SS14]